MQSFSVFQKLTYSDIMLKAEQVLICMLCDLQSQPSCAGKIALRVQLLKLHWKLHMYSTCTCMLKCNNIEFLLHHSADKF